VFYLQNECMPIFCPAYEIEVDGNCVPLVREIQAKKLQLDLYTNHLPYQIQAPSSNPTDPKWNPTVWVRSPCLDIEWTHISVVGILSGQSNLITFFRFSMTKVLPYKKGFGVRQIIAALDQCWENNWELLLDGHWQTVMVTIGQEFEVPFPAHETVLWESSDSKHFMNTMPFSIWKLMLCPRVSFTQFSIILYENKYVISN